MNQGTRTDSEPSRTKGIFPNKPNKKGRPKGAKNKINKTLTDCINKAFKNVGGVHYLESVAVTDPKTFCALLQRVIPREVNATINGEITFNLANAIVNARERATQSALDTDKPAMLERLDGDVVEDGVIVEPLDADNDQWLE